MEKNDKKLDYMQLMIHLFRDYTWPNDFLFKFIIPFDADKLNAVRDIFEKDTKITHQESKTSKYISVTAIQRMEHPDDVIAMYEKAEKIDKIVIL
jgi:putative lipoic acid-binding regulatory protein